MSDFSGEPIAGEYVTFDNGLANDVTVTVVFWWSECGEWLRVVELHVDSQGGCMTPFAVDAYPQVRGGSRIPELIARGATEISVKTAQALSIEGRA